MNAAYCQKCKRNLNDEWTACPYCGQKVHVAETVKPPCGFRILDKVKDAPMLVADLYWDAGKKQWDTVICDRVGFLGNQYARAINPGHGFRLLREDEYLTGREFEFTHDGQYWTKNATDWSGITARLYLTMPACKSTLAIRVPCDPPKPSPSPWKAITDLEGLPESGNVLHIMRRSVNG